MGLFVNKEIALFLQNSTIDIFQDPNSFKSSLNLPLLATITVLLLLISLFLVLMITFYERYGMDPMKRSLKNRLISNFLVFGLMFIGVSILQEFYEALVERNPRSRILYGFAEIWFAIGSLIVLNEIILWKYLIKVILKRLVAFNHDFIGVWLEITNITISFVFAFTELNGDMFAKHFRDPSVQHSHFYPPIRMPQILVAILYLQCFLATTHTVFDKCRQKVKKSSNQIQVHVIPINLPKNPPPFNNNSFNADLEQ